MSFPTSASFYLPVCLYFSLFTSLPVSDFLFFNCFFKGNFIFIYFWLRWVFIAARALSSCEERGLLFVAVRGLLIAVASRCRARALGAQAS